MLKSNALFLLSFLYFILIPGASTAAEDAAICKAEDRACILGQLRESADRIDNPHWKDQTYRELAKTLAFDGRVDEAIALIENIENPDTKAMTIRGIGMAAADNKLSREENDAVFAKLTTAAGKIDHPPSYAIALTYIAMAQAFAGDNEGAWKTAASMDNDGLRHKAYAETAEIQAEKGDFAAAMTSIGKIESGAFRNKAYGIVSNILADGEKPEEALQAAMAITNAYKRAQALQYVLDIQKPREVPQK